MGFGIKVETPKVEAPKVNVSGAVDGVKDMVSGAVDNARSSVEGAVDSIKSTVADAKDVAAGAVDGVRESLSSVAGAIADVAVSFTGAVEDIVLEPHLQLDANASFGKTKFEKGPVWIRVEETPENAKSNSDRMHLFSGSGTYDKILPVSQFKKVVGPTVVLLFEDAPMDETFSLEVLRADGSSRPVFNAVAYGDLRRTRKRFV